MKPSLALILQTLLLLTSGTLTVSAAAIREPGINGMTFGARQSIARRDQTVCGGIASLQQCGAGFPSSFCCPTNFACQRLNATATTSAVICCPEGQDCRLLQPFSCDQGLQNATATPLSQFHVEPPQSLGQCGSGCCPMGYDCNNGQCVLQPTTPSATGGITISSGSPITTSTSAADSSASNLPAMQSTGGFSGASFAAGFIPGILLGIIALGALIWYLRRRKAQKEARSREKSEDLTSLSTMAGRSNHNRSISEPTPQGDKTDRTVFLRESPIRSAAQTVIHNPATPSAGLPAQSAWSRSPFMNITPSTPPSTQPSLPSHLKRGTLSFKISPLRALKKQKSMHSLRRQATNASTSSAQRLRESTDRSRTGSTETIQVFRASPEVPYTPDQRAIPQKQPNPYELSMPPVLQSSPRNTTSTWQTTESDMASPTAIPSPLYVSSSSGRSAGPYKTPERPNGPGEAPALGTPYTPSRVGGGAGRGGLMVPGHDEKRDTTFSSIMSKAGLTEHDRMPGSRK